MGIAIGIEHTDEPFPLLRFITTAIAVALVYAAGMAMNDATDATVDRTDHPDRPIPSGAITRTHACLFAAAATAAALALFISMGTPVAAAGGTLIIAVIAYNLLHKITSASVLLMGITRAMVYITAAVAAASAAPHTEVNQLADLHATLIPTGYLLASLLGTYVAAFSFIARTETHTHIDTRRWLAPAIPIVILLAALHLCPTDWTWTALTALVLAAWLATAARRLFNHPPQTRQAVMAYLAGICLVDAYFLALLDRSALSLIAIACFIMTASAHRRIPGT